LKHFKTTVATYIWQLKHLKHTSRIIEKHPETHLKTIATIHNHPNKTHTTSATLETYDCNMPLKIGT
jgi:hypothetical protein